MLQQNTETQFIIYKEQLELYMCSETANIQPLIL